MFDIGGIEFFVIAVMAILLIGPKELPKLARAAGRARQAYQNLIAQVKGQVAQLEREVGMEEVQRIRKEIRDNPLSYREREEKLYYESQGPSVNTENK